jgi:hypothetical protein
MSLRVVIGGGRIPGTATSRPASPASTWPTRPSSVGASMGPALLARTLAPTLSPFDRTKLAADRALPPYSPIPPRSPTALIRATAARSLSPLTRPSTGFRRPFYIPPIPGFGSGNGGGSSGGSGGGCCS